MNAVIAKEVASLSPDERLNLIGEIWDTLAATPEAVPVPASHRAELERRLAVHQARPDDVVPWTEIEAQIDQRLRERQ